MIAHSRLPGRTLAVLLSISAASLAIADSLDDVFHNPRPEARPRVMWMWMGSNVSKPGITHDLEALKDAGFGGAMMFVLSDICAPWASLIGKSPTPDLVAFTDPWWKEVTNVWANRLIGDEQEPDDCLWTPGPRGNGRFLKEFPDWVANRKERPSKGRLTFTTWNYFTKDSPLTPSGLIGPVRLMRHDWAPGS